MYGSRNVPNDVLIILRDVPCIKFLVAHFLVQVWIIGAGAGVVRTGHLEKTQGSEKIEG